MSDQSAEADAKGWATKIPSGAEIIEDFIRVIETDRSLDEATIKTIKLLHAGGKLSSTNLLRNLEEARGKTKI